MELTRGKAQVSKALEDAECIALPTRACLASVLGYQCLKALPLPHKTAPRIEEKVQTLRKNKASRAAAKPFVIPISGPNSEPKNAKKK